MERSKLGLRAFSFGLAVWMKEAVCALQRVKIHIVKHVVCVGILELLLRATFSHDVLIQGWRVDYEARNNNTCNHFNCICNEYHK